MKATQENLPESVVLRDADVLVTDPPRHGKMKKRKNTIPKILIVDDDEISRQSLRLFLEKIGYATEEAVNGFDALRKVHPGIDLVMMDAVMPGMDGFEATRCIRENQVTGDLPIIMVTSLNGQGNRLKAISNGVNSFLSKPYDYRELKIRTTSLLKMKAAQDENKYHRELLERKVAERSANLEQTLQELKIAQERTDNAYLETINRLCMAVEYKDRRTGQHIRRVGGYCELIATKVGLPGYEAEKIRLASAMHDIGKIGIPDHILLKPGKLDATEWKVMQMHTTIGAMILQGSDSELLRAGEIIAGSHHERWDGSGYPKQLAGEDIPLYGRICILADTFDALTTERPYKEAFSNRKAFRIMAEGRSTLFDPRLYDLFIESKAEILRIQG